MFNLSQESINKINNFVGELPTKFGSPLIDLINKCLDEDNSPKGAVETKPEEATMDMFETVQE